MKPILSFLEVAKSVQAAGVALLILAGLQPLLQAAWKPAQGPLMTRWAKEVSPESVLPEYPRPQMVREPWLNLNGLWDYAVTTRDAKQPAQFHGKILVPFPIESALSGVMKRLDEKSRLWYRRTFEWPQAWQEKRALLHFDAVDWEATVYVNGKEVGTHRGGYDPFSFDITDALKAGGAQEIVVAVWDPTEGGQPRGKQSRNPGGIMYTPASGIWQTVWLEPVAAAHFKALKITPDLDQSSVAIQSILSTSGGKATVMIDVIDRTRIVQSGEISVEATDEATAKGTVAPRIVLKVPNAKPWSPDSPFLYDIKARLLHNGKVVDAVSSYFGLRKIALGKDQKGITRILLNNEFVFQMGFLDQGFWPDGIYTAPTDEALRYDIEMTKQLGMNMARKHVKVEPQRWYYWCDKLGLLVWQDMPSSGNRTAEDKEQFEHELQEMVQDFHNHPSIILWVVFNEGWGQYDTERLTKWVEEMDPSRLVNNASGWTDKNVGDVIDMHNYPGPGSPKPEPDRAAVLGEFGGLGLAIDGHTWTQRSWGYQGMADRSALTKRYIGLLRKVYELKDDPGLNAAVYTQTTDVETECNGLMTYDRAMVKPDLEKVAAANRGIFPPAPQVTVVVPTSEKQASSWRYTFEKPADDWFKPDFDAGSWKEGPAGFGTRGTPGSVVRTEWRSGDIWLRREFTLPETATSDLFLMMHHDEDAEVYLNGVLAAKVTGYTTAYEEAEIRPEAKAALKPGKNTIAVHCHQTQGGQYIDVGLVRITEPPQAAGAAAGVSGVTMRPQPPAVRGSLYVANRDPLTPSPFMKLPIGNITPKGWLRHMLELERDGMIGHLKEISPWLNFETSAWASKEGQGERGWEELPYWLKGYGDLGYVLKDESIIREARRWIEAVLSSQREDGWFGPRALLTSLNGKPDLWPHMVMLNILQSHYEFTGDDRVLPFIKRYFQWQDKLPPSAFGEGYWPKLRAGDNIESVFWLYNRLGESWLLGLARKIHDNMARWDEDVINWHNVNIAQGFRAGTVFWMQSKDATDLASAERNYRKVMAMYGQFPGGGFVGDENCRPGYDDPRGGIETCGIVEFTHSFQMLTRITGDPVWADRCEEIAFNSFPASMTPDQKGLHYITSANQVQLDRQNKSPGIQNRGTMFSYSPFQVYRCCQHNVSHGWPYYAEELWLATADNGLCASLYAASEVTAQVGDGTTVKIAEETDYPFSETITFRVTLPKAVKFPLYLRVPRWCQAAAVAINGATASVRAQSSQYLVLDRQWQDGDTVTLRLPMQVTVHHWPKNKDAVSVDYGPLSFALAIKERWEKYGDRDPAWPEWEVFPESAWNYGLVLEAQNPARSFEVVRKPGPVPAQPFTPETAPIALKAKARKIPQWQMDRLNMVGVLQPSPAKTDEPVETITLIPMGAARLRIAAFPTVSTAAEAHEWVAPTVPKPSRYQASASHCHSGDTVEALGDGLEPTNSNDQTIPRFTWWSHRGTTEWVQYDFPQPMTVSGVSVYWFDDTAVGQCRVPASWRLLYKEGNDWKPAKTESQFGTRPNTYNALRIEPVKTGALRLEVQLQENYSGGILEWKVQPAPASSGQPDA